MRRLRGLHSGAQEGRRMVMIEFDRRQGIGGSDVPAIVGMSPYRSALDLWDEKRGDTIEREPSMAMKIGTMLEDGIAKLYADAAIARLRKPKVPFGLVLLRRPTTGEPVKLIPATDIAERFGYPTWAQVDRIRIGHVPDPGQPKVSGVEVKHTSLFDRFAGDEVPDDVAVQVQHAMMLTGWRAMDVVSLSAGRNLKITTVEADPEAHEAIAEACRRFWQQVVDGEQPEPDGSDAASRWIRDRYKHEQPEKVVVATHDVLPQIAEVLRLAAVKKEAERELEEAKQRIMLFMGDAERLDAPGDVKITWKSQAGRHDWKAVAADLRRMLLDPEFARSLAPGDTLQDAIDFIESMHTGEPTRVFRVSGKAVAL